MTRERWVDEKWPSRLKQARGTDLQKVAAERFGVSTETYKKWEQGVRPPAPRYMDLVCQFTAYLESKT
jgi:DNA-binding transcriptional regulator YiaG